MGEEKSRDSKEMTYLFSFNQILLLPCNTVRIGVNRIRWMQRVHTRVKIVTTSTNRRNRGLVFKRCLEMIIQISLTTVGVVLRRENLSSRFERRILNIDLRSNEAVWRFSLSLSLPLARDLILRRPPQFYRCCCNYIRVIGLNWMAD